MKRRALLGSAILAVVLLVGAGVATSDIRPLLRKPPSPGRGAPAMPTALWSSLIQDGQMGNQYTFVAVLNTASVSQTVTISFYSKTGSKITDTSAIVTAGQQWQVFTGSAGGVAATKRMDGYAKLTTTGNIADLHVWSVLVMPNQGNYPGYVGSWVAR